METYKHPQLGDIAINKSPKAIRLSLTVRPSGIVLTVPQGFSTAEALAFLESKKEWVAGAVERNKQRVKPPVTILPPFRTRMHNLTLEAHAVARYDIFIKGGEITVKYPLNKEPESEAVQKIVRKAVTEAYRIEAKHLLPGRVKELAAANGFRCGAVTFRNAVTRWGSCSVDNSISLSVHLMTLPNHLIDYVILHELCHTVEKNHGPKFHKLLDKVTAGKHRKMRAELKKYTTRW